MVARKDVVEDSWNLQNRAERKLWSWSLNEIVVMMIMMHENMMLGTGTGGGIVMSMGVRRMSLGERGCCYVSFSWNKGKGKGKGKGKIKSCSATRRRYPVVTNELGGQYEDDFSEVGKHLLNYFTTRAVRTVLGQLHEMNPTQYAWLYQFCVENKLNDGKRFLRVLVKERQELGERVMITRLHLFNKWAKKYNHLEIHQAIADQNLELMRERLVETVKWPTENDSDSENIS